MKLLKFVGLILTLSVLSCTKDPAACFSVDKGTTTKVNEEIQFDASCSVNAETYSWDFGDSSTGTGVQVKHKYSVKGKYIIKLVAKKADKSSDFIQQIDIQ
jgi:PKD repeat protein